MTGCPLLFFSSPPVSRDFVRTGSRKTDSLFSRRSHFRLTGASSFARHGTSTPIVSFSSPSFSLQMSALTFPLPLLKYFCGTGLTRLLKFIGAVRGSNGLSLQFPHLSCVLLVSRLFFPLYGSLGRLPVRSFTDVLFPYAIWSVRSVTLVSLFP